MTIQELEKNPKIDPYPDKETKQGSHDTDELKIVHTVEPEKNPQTEPLEKQTDALPKLPDTEITTEKLPPLLSSKYKGFFTEVGVISNKLDEVQKEMQKQQEAKDKDEREKLFEHISDVLENISSHLITMNAHMQEADQLVSANFGIIKTVMAAVTSTTGSESFQQMKNSEKVTQVAAAVYEGSMTVASNKLGDLVVGLITIPLTPWEKKMFIDNLFEMYTYDPKQGKLGAMGNMCDAFETAAIDQIGNLRKRIKLPWLRKK